MDDDRPMTFSVLDASTTAALQAAGLTYSEVGATARELPHGYTAFRRSTVVRGSTFEAAAAALSGWRIQQQAGIVVTASDLHVHAGSVVVLRLGVGPLRVRAPCRVVFVVDEPGRRGFAYGTLPGHPESGEESFVLMDLPHGPVLEITAFSRPATALTRVVGPVGQAVQRVITRRYLRGLDHL